MGLRGVSMWMGSVPVRVQSAVRHGHYLLSLAVRYCIWSITTPPARNAYRIFPLSMLKPAAADCPHESRYGLVAPSLQHLGMLRRSDSCLYPETWLASIVCLIAWRCERRPREEG